MTEISEPTLSRKTETSAVLTRQAAQARVLDEAKALVEVAVRSAGQATTFLVFEKELIGRLAAFGRLLLALFLAASEERVSASLAERVLLDGRRCRRSEAKARNLMTWFGVVRYERTYLREVVGRGEPMRGFFPLDAELGLPVDRFSPNLISVAVRLATRVSFSEACELLRWFLPTAPSTEVVEAATLGYGRHTQEWFETAPAPDDDGEVLIIHIDSKAVPTATDEELLKRRGKRSRKPKAPSPRHRGRCARERRTKKPRRKKGDKSKNGKMGTMVVMYTLRRSRRIGGDLLLGPINKKLYASFANKRHAVEVARREATKRGFPPGTRKTVQVLTDGDAHLAEYIDELFPEAEHTIDIMHVTEKLWEAGAALFGEGTDARATWVEARKDELYAGDIDAILDELDRRLRGISRTGPGTRDKRDKLNEVRDYIHRRIDRMNYGHLLERDMELGTGAVEGAIKNIMGRRMDHGGMRWIKERAEATLQLRCIDVNGDWEAFTARVHEGIRSRAIERGELVRLQQRQPEPLPTAHLQKAA
jgi:hypothetical protein